MQLLPDLMAKTTVMSGYKSKSQKNRGNIEGLHIFSFYFGPSNEGGHTFKDTYADYEKNFQQPFSKHVYNCFREFIFTAWLDQMS